jgi:hypothetical protein
MDSPAVGCFLVIDSTGMREDRRTAETLDQSFVERVTRLSDRVAGIRFQLEPGESYVVTGLAGRVSWFPTALGSLRLTNRRLIYIPQSGIGRFMRGRCHHTPL